jgi:hypothetical protein
MISRAKFGIQIRGVMLILARVSPVRHKPANRIRAKFAYVGKGNAQTSRLAVSREQNRTPLRGPEPASILAGRAVI